MVPLEAGVAQRVDRGIALLFHDRDTRRGWVVSSTAWPHFTPGKDPVPILQEAGWAPGSVWTGGKSLPHRDSIPDRPVRSQSLYRLSYPAHNNNNNNNNNNNKDQFVNIVNSQESTQPNMNSIIKTAAKFTEELSQPRRVPQNRMEYNTQRQDWESP